MLKDIKSINHFSSAYDLLEYFYGEDWIEDELTEDEICFLRSMDDFESFDFYLVNDEYVLVSESCFCSCGETETIEEFYKSTIEYVKEYA